MGNLSFVVEIKISRQNAMSNNFSTKAFRAVELAMAAKKYKDLTIPLLHEYCASMVCIRCKLARDGSQCACEFKRSPRFWDMPLIAKVLNVYKRKKDKELARDKRN